VLRQYGVTLALSNEVMNTKFYVRRDLKFSCLTSFIKSFDKKNLANIETSQQKKMYETSILHSYFIVGVYAVYDYFKHALII
jgi:hypothetical protein